MAGLLVDLTHFQLLTLFYHGLTPSVLSPCWECGAKRLIKSVVSCQIRFGVPQVTSLDRISIEFAALSILPRVLQALVGSQHLRPALPLCLA